ncbi:hypothetical protein F5883DRAFT_644341 [Diaporthe sp. PMI_573]|nr:hypothetical protein F5883DRAFT_644341 [Diaporthaceae sp. PMI_573]
MAGQDGRADNGLDTGVFRLFDPGFPKELRLNVFESLVPDPLPIGTSPSLSPDILDSRAALVNLCLTNKECYALAMPLLYRHIIITDYVQMAGLLVNLIFFNDRRKWMRSLAVLVEVEPEGYDDEKTDGNFHFMTRTISWLETYNTANPGPNVLGTFNAVRALLPRFADLIAEAPVVHEDSPDPDEDYVPDGFREFHASQLNDVYEQFLRLLLRMQINIKDILITVQDDFRQFLCPADLQHRIFTQFWVDPARPISENPFENLVSIRKQASPHNAVSFRQHPLEPEYIRSKNWEFFRDNGNWFFNDHLDEHGWPRHPQPPRDLRLFSHITKLGLHESLTHPALLRVILSSCTSLKALCYTTDATEWTRRFQPRVSAEEEEIPAPTLQQALDVVSGTLTELRLGWDPWGAVLTEEEEAAVAPHRVDVSGFPRLTSCEIDQAFVR